MLNFSTIGGEIQGGEPGAAALDENGQPIPAADGAPAPVLGEDGQPIPAPDAALVEPIPEPEVKTPSFMRWISIFG